MRITSRRYLRFSIKNINTKNIDTLSWTTTVYFRLLAMKSFWKRQGIDRN